MTQSRGRIARRALCLGALAAALALLAIPAAGAGLQNRTQRVPGSIDATGGGDVTDALRDFFASVPNGSTIEFPQGAKYRVDGTIGLVNRRNLTFLGHGATILATTEGDRTRSQWRLVGGSGIVFRNLVVRGANPNGGVEENAYVADLEAQHGFEILGATGVELDRVTVTDVYGDFVYMGLDRNGDWASRIWVHDSTFARNGRQGIAVTAGRDIVIERNTLSDTRRATFDLEPNSSKGGVERTFILDNEIGSGRLLFIASHGNGPVDDVTVSGNRLTGHALTIDVKAPPSARRHRFWVLDNSSSKGNGPTPILFDNVDDVVVHNNIQPVTRVDEAGVGLRDVCGATVTDNDFGAGIAQAHVGGTECAAAASEAEPVPPAIPGRDPESRRKLEPVVTTTQPSATTDPPLPTASASGDGGGGGGSTGLIVGVGIALVVAVGVVLMILRSRSRSSRRRYYRSYDE